MLCLRKLFQTVLNYCLIYVGVDQRIMIFITPERNQGLIIPLSFTKDQVNILLFK
ncbi:hypothetical protein E2320_002468, partial [Naja naja]